MIYLFVYFLSNYISKISYKQHTYIHTNNTNTVHQLSPSIRKNELCRFNNLKQLINRGDGGLLTNKYNNDNLIL